MRVRPLRTTDRRPVPDRRPRAIAAVPDLPEEATDGVPSSAVEHLAERRHRASVAPEDHALYACRCGLQFQAPVSTSVTCPECGTAQAW